MQHVYDLGTGKHISIDGMLVERDALRIAEAINDYDPNLVVLCVDPNRATDISEAPFIIAEKCKDGITRPVFKCWELNDSVLDRIRFADGNRMSASKSLEQIQNEILTERERRYTEKREISADISTHVLKTRQSHYTVVDTNTGETIHFYDDRPTERKTSKAEVI